VDVRAIELIDGRAADETQRAIEIGAKDFNGAVDACFASGSETVGIRSSTKNGASAKAKSFDDVGAAANAPIHEDFGLPVHGFDYFRQRSQRGLNTVELAAAMV
jgi:hypothetical protein